MYKHPKQLIAVDCVIFGFEDDELKLLVFERQIPPHKGEISLPGGLVNSDESVPDAATRVLRQISGLDNIYMELVDVFSEVNRDSGGRVISVAYYALLNINEQNKQLIENNSAQWLSLNQMPELIMDHGHMLSKSLEKLRYNASYHIIGQHLLPEKFTLLQLRKLYNAIFDKEFDPGNFRKKILSLNILKQLSEKENSESKRGAFYYKFRKNCIQNNKQQIFRI